MPAQPLERRYGYGAARLPISAPIESQRLSESARSRAPHERLAAAIPGLLCAGMAALLVMAASFELTDDPMKRVASEPAEIDIALWALSEAPPRIVEPAAPEERSPRILEPEPELVDVSDVNDVPKRAPKPAEPIGAEEEDRGFDPNLLTMAPTRAMTIPAPETGIVPARHESRLERPPSEPARSSRLALEALTESRSSASAPAAPFAGTDDVIGGVGANGAIGSPIARATRRPAPSLSARASLDLPMGSPSGTREEFLTALRESGASGDRASSATAPMSSARPHVAAAIEIGRDVRERVRQQARGDGWYEVPLDQLPACSPPERQDRLKKEILLATARRRVRECSHPEGQYRFLETRNLNAFLMWSRTNPESASAQRPARDVCDVLERALVCLEGASQKDLGVE